MPMYIFQYLEKLDQTTNSLQMEIVSKYCILQRYWYLYCLGKTKRPSANTQPRSTFRKKKKCQSQELTGELLLLPGWLLSEMGLFITYLLTYCSNRWKSTVYQKEDDFLTLFSHMGVYLYICDNSQCTYSPFQNPESPFRKEAIH